MFFLAKDSGFLGRESVFGFVVLDKLIRCIRLWSKRARKYCVVPTIRRRLEIERERERVVGSRRKILVNINHDHGWNHPKNW